MKKTFRKLKDIILFGPDIRIYAIILTLALIASLIPLYLLTKYAIPYFDDYGYGRAVWQDYRWGNYHLKAAVMGSIKNTILMWHTWQGTYSSIFLMGLVPIIFGEQYYILGPIFLISVFAISLFVFTGVISKKYLKTDFFTTLALQSGITLMLTIVLYSPQQGFYWYNGGVHYVGMFSFELLYLSLMILLLHGLNGFKKLAPDDPDRYLSSNSPKKKIPRIILLVTGVLLSTFLGFFLAGANFVTVLQIPILLVSLGIIAVIKKQKGILLWIPSLIAYAVGMYLNVSAPGNAARQGYYPDAPGPLKAVLLSFPESFKFMGKFVNLRTCLLFLLLVPVFWDLAGKLYRKKIRFSLPGLLVFALWAECVYAASFTPGLYGTGRIDLDRMINVNQLTFLLLLTAVVCYGAVAVRGIIFDRLAKKGKFIPEEEIIRAGQTPNKDENIKTGTKYLQIPLILLAAWCCAMFLTYHYSPNRAGHFSSYGAYYYLKTNEAKAFYNEYKLRLALLKTNEREIVFKPYTVKPWFLIWEDLSSDPSAQQNRCMAEYYGKSSVRVE